MKIKSINSDSLSKSIRYNPNTIGTHLQIKKGFPSSGKRNYCTMCLITMLNENGYEIDFNNNRINITQSNEKMVL